MTAAVNRGKAVKRLVQNVRNASVEAEKLLAKQEAPYKKGHATNLSILEALLADADTKLEQRRYKKAIDETQAILDSIAKYE